LKTSRIGPGHARGGAEADSASSASELDFTPKQPGAYRFIAYRDGCPWIVSNPIYVP